MLIVNENNSYQTIDYSPDCGKMFVCAGKLPILEVYDEETLKRVVDLEKGASGGHCNKILCAKFDSVNPDIIYSGGWDRNVVIWDVRSGKSIGSINGPLICGEAIDSDPRTHMILTGSHTIKEGIQLWDLRSLGQIQTIPWSIYKSTASASTLTYCAKFIKPKKLSILACGIN